MPANTPALSVRSACLGAALLLACAGSASAQNALGDGRALDRNLQAGSGGKLPGGTRRDAFAEQMRFNNAVISGTATGGKAFRDYSPSQGFERFGNRLGSDDLYSFQRDAAASGLTGLGVRGTDALRYQFSLTTGTPATVADTRALGQWAGSLSRPANVTTSASPTALRSTAEYVATRSLQPTAVGVRQDEYGAEFTARASPLLGVTWTKTGESPLSASNAAPSTNSSANPGGVPAPVNPASPNPAGQSPATSPSGAGQQQPVQISPITGFPVKPDADKPRPPTQVYTRIMDQVRADTSGVPAQPNTRVEQPGTPVPQGAAPIGQPGTQPAGGADATKPAPIDASLDAQLQRLRAMMRGEPVAPPKAPTPPDALNPMGRDKPAPDAADPTRAAPKAPPTPVLTPELQRGLKRSGDRKQSSLVDQAKLPPGFDPRGGAPVNLDEYTKMMSKGQDLLAQGKFFDAEDRFAMAARAFSNDPMARVGRLHAQLGAGLFLSAAQNLRTLVADHPELVGVRYEARLLPTVERSQNIALQLENELRRAGPEGGGVLQRDAALLMAYLGYQLSDKDLLKTGLDEFALRINPEDAGDRAMLDLIQNVWEPKSP